ncbi:unnamed protein product [Closterium sp. NIES-64]|nr:unnamed protein product [Closterium sp. NIES-64]
MGEASSTESAPAQSTSSAKPSAPPNGAGLPAAMAEVVGRHGRPPHSGSPLRSLLPIAAPHPLTLRLCIPRPAFGALYSPFCSSLWHYGTRYGDMEHVAAAFDAAETRACPPPCHWSFSIFLRPTCLGHGGAARGHGGRGSSVRRCRNPRLSPPLSSVFLHFPPPHVLWSRYEEMDDVAAAFDIAETPHLSPTLSSTLSSVFLQFSSAPHVCWRGYEDMEDVAAAFDAAETPPLSPPLSSGRDTGTWRTWQQRLTLQKSRPYFPPCPPPCPWSSSNFPPPHVYGGGGTGTWRTWQQRSTLQKPPPWSPPLFLPLVLDLPLIFLPPHVFGGWGTWTCEDVETAFDAAEAPALVPPPFVLPPRFCDLPLPHVQGVWLPGYGGRGSRV